jgi:hypothetical protein
MNISESEWIAKAEENVNMYFLNRGDEDQELKGDDLRNTIG